MVVLFNNCKATYPTSISERQLFIQQLFCMFEQRNFSTHYFYALLIILWTRLRKSATSFIASISQKD